MLVPTEWDTIVRGRTREVVSSEVSAMCSDESSKRKQPESTTGSMPTKKRKKTVVHAGTDQNTHLLQTDESTTDTGTVRSISDVCHSILCGINKVHHEVEISPTQQELNLDCVLSRVPYRQLLEDLFGGNRDLEPPSIPLVSRVYEVTPTLKLAQSHIFATIFVWSANDAHTRHSPFHWICLE